ncbi:hypothetical protein ACJIZ3_012761 [Penstemon smallii]|uniref:Uncharacterized protein n=1 Tax=Penstemon smallii TaxID=265156 RepID=A0ABD3UMZ4_9LAMI
MNSKILCAFLFAVLLIQSCILYDAEARNVVKVTCDNDEECFYICKGIHGACVCLNFGDTEYKKCTKKVCSCDPPPTSESLTIGHN